MDPTLASEDGNDQARRGDDAESRSAEAEVVRLNLELESRVAERTAQLREAYRELEAFSYSVSHDLRAPLRHIRGYAELLADSARGKLDAQETRYLAVIARASRELDALIEDLLELSRTSLAEMRHLEVDLDALVAEAVASLELQVADRPVEWRIEKLPRVTGDPSLLRLVWANLLGNALKYTRGRAPATIEVGCTRHDHGLPVLHVRDNGVGFEMEHAAKLFGVFQRLHRAEE
ncbi:MAG TPA: histidine kinase dimerization/phospho-acceptor domain-containing protein, partial [Myxococcota bacterium]|nr:histidine kinase dimerization/phospho-acceptor domain-containing protein [Myxococcota bacterium]